MKIFGWNLFGAKEKRAAERVRLFEELYVDYIDAANATVSGSGESLDFSSLGIRFISHHPFRKGDALKLRIRFTPGILPVSEILVEAKAVRCNRRWREKFYRIGCKFENVNEETRSRLEFLVNYFREREKKYLFFRYNTPDE